MKPLMLATTALAAILLIPIFSTKSTQEHECGEMLSIQNVTIVCETDSQRSEINHIYREVLGRDADPQGLETWSHKLSRRSTLKDIRHEIAESDEAKNAVNQIYQEVLGRNADLSGVETYTKNLTRSWSLGDVRRDIQESDEARGKRLS